jgi:hypothetical protein
MALVSVVIIGSRSRRTRDHILLTHDTDESRATAYYSSTFRSHNLAYVQM